ncbi:hypothetical protein FRC11_013661 [Ceratobasidium sp. 423]|nr:hypothetical protein FRC11_013661 [Ceratobasidium sp. 423]
MPMLKLDVRKLDALSVPGRKGDSHGSNTSEEELMAPLSEEELLVCHMADVDAELLRWEQFEWTGEDSLGSVELVKFWRVHKHQFPLLYWVTMDVLPVQALAVSSEHVFSSKNIEYLQVLKHSLHRHHTTEDNHQMLDFMSHIANPDDDNLE